MVRIEIAAEKLFSVLGFGVTNTLLMAFVTMSVLTIVAVRVNRGLSLVPSAMQQALEILVEKLLGTMESVFGSQEKAQRYFPFIATIFLFVLISNWLGVVPGIGSIGLVDVHEGEEVFVPLFRSTASDLNFTLALAVISVFAANIFGILAIGAWKHASKFFSFKSPIDFFVGILEFISEIAKMISFSFRLFGNIFAGEVLLVIMAFLVPIVVPVPFLMLELFVGFVQALVFAMLTMVFISIAVSHH